MQKLNKTIAVIIIAILAASASITLLPNTKAHTPPRQIQTSSFIHVAPNPAGIGQTVTISF
jgi:hypothetical protein